jgi:protein PhnA
MAKCATCDLQLHKNELIEQNNLLAKLDSKQIAKDLTKEMKKIFKGKGWK